MDCRVISAFTRVHSPSKTGVNALHDALCPAMTALPASRHMTFFCLGLPAGRVTELLRSNVSSVTRGAIHEFAMAGAGEVPGVVETAVEVVGDFSRRAGPP